MASRPSMTWLFWFPAQEKGGPQAALSVPHHTSCWRIKPAAAPS